MNLAGDQLRAFGPAENETWQRLFEKQAPRTNQQIVPLFSRGLGALGLDGKSVPDLQVVNRRLETLTGFRAVPVEGLVEPVGFFRLLSERKFPVGNFIRSAQDLTYTPAPDVFHDLYGHLPFLAESRYADFCAKFGVTAVKYADNPEVIAQFDRLFWFGVEFALMETPLGLRIFGAGLASSFLESDYALSGTPELLPFDLERIRHQEFSIDRLQSRLFVLRDEQQLYQCLPEFEEGLWFYSPTQVVS
ncbi:MAG: phenylalanine 4-monooxygenase [Bdellovibrionota bacterium]